MKPEYKIPYKVSTTISPEMQEAVVNVLKSGKFSLGWEGIEFEKEFSKMFNVKHALTLNSGTSALISAFLACNIGMRDEVIVSPYVFWGAAHVIVNVGANPVFVEPDPDTFNLDPSKIEAAITSKTKAIEPVYMYGQVCDMDPINEIAEKYDLYVIEDACHACGAKYKGKYAGTLGDAASFSFNTKNITCGGEGGMASTNEDETDEKMRLLRYVGTRGTHAEGTRTYTSDHVGYNFRLAEVLSAVGRRQLKELPKWNTQRNKNAQLYDKLLAEIPEVQTPVVTEGCEHVYLHYVLKVQKRDALKDYLIKQGIEAKIVYNRPVYRSAVYREQFGYKDGTFPISDHLCTENLGIPVQPFLTEEQIQFVCDSIRTFYKTT